VTTLQATGRVWFPSCHRAEMIVTTVADIALLQ
jgi:hypothetical protein